MTVLSSPLFIEQSEPSGRGPEDAALVRQALRGDADAFGELYERYAERVHRYVRFRVRDRSASRDLTQDVFISALRGLPGLRQEDRFEQWLFRIAHNTLVNYWQRQGRRPHLLELKGLDDEERPASHALPSLGEEPSRAENAQTTVEIKMEAERVLELLDKLTEIQGQVITLRFVAGLSVHDTAAVMKRSEDSVKKLQRRGLASLRRHYDAEVAKRERP